MRHFLRNRTALRAFAATALLLSAIALPAQDSADKASGASGTPGAIHLKSRTFTPPPGVETGLRDTLQKARRDTVGLIQLDEIPDGSVRAQLERAGVVLLDYVPDNAWIAKLPADIDRAAAVSGVRWIGRLLPQDKLAPGLLAKARGLAQKGSMTLDVEAVPGSFEEAVARIEALGGRVEERDETLSSLRISLPRAAVQSLAESDAVIWISPDLPRRAFNNFMRSNARINQVHQAPYGLTGAGVQLGMWDGGQVFAHTDFGTRLTVVEPGTVDAHATHVAGTMAGSGQRSVNFGFPANHFRGAAHGADILNWDFLGTPYSEHNAAINTYGIDNSQNSWGADVSTANGNCALYGDYHFYSREYDLIVNGTYGRKIPVVFAAGNERNDGDCSMSSTAPFLNYSVVPPPATAKDVIAVGAINGDDSAMTEFSSWGPTDDGRIRPDIVTAGCNAGSNPFPAIVSTSVTNGYAGSCGTSMAAPAVSGSIALLLQRYRAVCPATGTDPLPSTIKALLIHSARDLDDSSSFLNRGPDYASGYGAMDVQAAVDMLPFHHEDQVSNGQIDTFQIVVTRQTDLKVTLVWDDPAAAANASVALINNLDLWLEDPNGGIHRPWILNPSSPANAATRNVDNRNVVEQVVVDNVTGLIAGTWTIKVRGTSVPSGPQSYTLVSEHLQVADSSCDGAPAADAWIMDKDVPLSPVDPGTEPNPDNGPMWESNHIWVRYDDLGNPGHLSPEVGQPNYVNAIVKNRGTTTLNTVRVKFYVASSSTGLGWPEGWTLIGERTVVNLPAGQQKTVNVRWDPPGIGHFCLYVRLISDQDPMASAEGPSVQANAKNNNNIAWRNVDAYDVFAEGPVVVLFGNTLRTRAAIGLNFNIKPDPKGGTLLDFAQVRVRIDDRLAQLIAEQGIRTEFPGFERIDDHTLQMAQPTAFFPDLPIGGWEEYPLEIEVTPRLQIWNQETYILDIQQNFPADSKAPSPTAIKFDPEDPNIGGVRLEIRSVTPKE